MGILQTIREKRKRKKNNKNRRDNGGELVTPPRMVLEPSQRTNQSGEDGRSNDGNGEQREEEDFLAALFDETMEQKRPAPEAIELPPQPDDHIRKIASLLAVDLASPVNLGSLGSAADPFSQVLIKYLSTSSLNNAFEGIGRNFSPADRAGIILSQGVLKSKGAFFALDGAEGLSEYLIQVGKSFGPRLERLLALEIKDGEKTPLLPLLPLKEVPVPLDYQHPFFAGFEPEVLMAAQAVYALLSGYGERIASLKDKTELAQLVFVAQSAKKLPLPQARKLISQVLDPHADLDALVTHSLVSLALENHPPLARRNSAEVTEHYEKISRSRFRYACYLAERFSELGTAGSDLESQVRAVYQEVEKMELTFNLFPWASKGRSKINSKDFLRLISQMKVMLYEIVPAGEKVGKKGEEFVRTVQAEQGEEYGNKLSVKDLPLGSVGKMLDKQIYFNGHNYVSGLQDAEIQKLKLAFPFPFHKGMKVRLVSNLGLDGGRTFIEYFEGGTPDTIPLGSEGTIDFVERNKVQVSFPSRGWLCHSQELEPVSEGEEAQNSREKRKEVHAALERIVAQAKKEGERSERERNDLVQEGTQILQGMGLSKSAVRIFFGHYLPGEPAKYVQNGLLSPEDPYAEIKRWEGQMNYPSLAKKVEELIKEREGILLPTLPQVEDVHSYERFRADLEERVLQGYKLGPEKKKFTQGEKVAPLQDQEKFPAGTPVDYAEWCTQCNRHVVNAKGYGNIHINGSLVTVEPAFDFPPLPTELKAGSKVVLKKITDDAPPHKGYYKHDGTGVLQENYEVGDDNKLQIVCFTDGCRYEYLKRELELAEAPPPLKGAALQKYEWEMQRREEKKKELTAQLHPLLVEAEAAYERVLRQRDELSLRCIDELRSLGWEDALIFEKFQKGLGHADYLKERGMLNVPLSKEKK